MDLRSLPIIDQHAHNVLRPEAAARRPYPAAFTEGYDPEVIERHARHTLFYRRSRREIGALLGCAAEEEAILARRESLGLERLTELCFRAAGLEAVLLDDGFLPGEILPVEWHGQFVPAHRVLRLEALAQDLLTPGEDFATFLERFRAALDPPPSGVVALKSIAAYRSGLAVESVPRAEAAAHFTAWQRAAGAGPPRLADKALIDFLLTQALELAARHRLPVQFHTGFGDPDLDLRLANPLHLRPLLEEPRYRAAPVVLLHASYPFTREAGYLASVYPHVYLDAGLAVPFLSVAGMRAVLGMLLELAPTTKLLYSSDAHLIPELYYLAAAWGRALLGEALEQAVRDTDLTAREADAVAAAVLAENARALYRLPRAPLTSPAPS
jgi:predicted TIM-barrel fold metal-dependent hydrolase